MGQRALGVGTRGIRRWAGIVTSAILLASGCYTTPNESRLERGVALAEALDDSTFEAAPVASETLTGAIDFPRLLALARTNNASLIRSGYQALIARAQRDEAFAAVVLPRLSGRAARFTRSNTPASLARFGGASVRIPTGQKEVETFVATLNAPLFSASDFIFRFNAVSSEAKAVKLGTIRVWQEVRRAVLVAALQLLDLQSQLEAFDALLRSLREREREARDLVEAGKAITNDVLKVRVEIANQEQAKTELANAVESTRVLLSSLIGIDPDSRYSVIFDRLAPSDAPVPSIADAFRIARSSRPELLAFELRRETSRQRIFTEWAAYLPRLDLIGEYNFNNAANLLEDDFFSYTLLASVDLIDFGRHPRIARFKAEMGDLEAQALELERRLRVDVETGCRAVANELSRLRQGAIAETASTENLRVERALYAEGLATVNDLLNAEVGLLRDQVTRRSARFRYFLRLVELDAIVGSEGFAFQER